MNIASQLDTHGFAIVPNVLDATGCGSLSALLGETEGAGTRLMLREVEVARFARSPLARLVAPHLPDEPVPCVAFTLISDL